MNGRQPRMSGERARIVRTTDDAELLWQLDATGMGAPEHAEGGAVAHREDGGRRRAMGEQFIERHLSRVLGKVAVDDVSRLETKLLAGEADTMIEFEEFRVRRAKGPGDDA